jgi:hypothetical protein
MDFWTGSTLFWILVWDSVSSWVGASYAKAPQTDELLPKAVRAIYAVDSRPGSGFVDNLKPAGL